MMHIPPADARRLSLYEYEALLFNWNEAHDTKSEAPAPDAEESERLIAAINATPELTH